MRIYRPDDALARFSTIHKWEQGNGEPGGAAKTLLAVARLHPEAVREALAIVELLHQLSKNFLHRFYSQRLEMHDLRQPVHQLQIDPANLAGLINLIATIPFLLTNQFAKSVSLERAIKANLRGLGYAL